MKVKINQEDMTAMLKVRQLSIEAREAVQKFSDACVDILTIESDVRNAKAQANFVNSEIQTLTASVIGVKLTPEQQPDNTEDAIEIGKRGLRFMALGESWDEVDNNDNQEKS